MTMPNETQQSRVAVVGMFDGVHIGHLHLLSTLRAVAAEHSQRPLVITFSNHPLEEVAPEKAPGLLTSPTEKKLLLASQGVDVKMLPFTHELRNTSTSGFLQMMREKWNVSRLILGFNNRFGHNPPATLNEYRQLGASQGIEIMQADELTGLKTEKISSSEIRRLISNNRIEQANSLLGREYTVPGIVSHGKEIGRTIGFPTANVVPDFRLKLIPAAGVYAATALLNDGSEYPAMVNIGTRPTIGSGLSQTIEANLIGFEGNLYSQQLTLNFNAYLRKEQNFESLDALKAQLQADREQVLQILTRS